MRIPHISAVLLLCFFALSTAFKPAVKEEIKWMSFEEMQQEYAKQPRPILVDMYTDWCGWCKEMDKKTYTNSKLVSYINKHYYAVRYNAESRTTVNFNSVTYKYNPQYKANDLAMYLSFGRLEFPTTIFLSAIDARPAPLSGYLKPAQMEAPIRYFAERSSTEESFVDFNKKLKKEW